MATSRTRKRAGIQTPWRFIVEPFRPKVEFTSHGGPICSKHKNCATAPVRYLSWMKCKPNVSHRHISRGSSIRFASGHGMLAKALSGGLVPVSAVLMTDKIYHAVYSSLKRAIVHTSTFSENSLAMRAG